jgi:tetratricopeptide (TPR) repeat protein
VVVFWGTWSPRSAKALEIWQRFGDRYAQHGVQVITVNADHQHMEAGDIEKVRQYVTDHEISLPVIVDSELEFFNEIGVIVLPTTMFFKPDGTLDYKYPGLPSSAELDLKEDLEIKLGIAKETTEEEAASRGKLAYQPKNNALLFYNMGKILHRKGFPQKAKAKYIEALQKDPDYEDPLRGLETIFFVKEHTPENEERLKVLLIASGLENVAEKISLEDAEPIEPEIVEPEVREPEAGKSESGEAPAAGEKDKPLTPMERMRLLMKNKK